MFIVETTVEVYSTEERKFGVETAINIKSKLPSIWKSKRLTKLEVQETGSLESKRPSKFKLDTI